MFLLVSPDLKPKFIWKRGIKHAAKYSIKDCPFPTCSISGFSICCADKCIANCSICQSLRMSCWWILLANPQVLDLGFSLRDTTSILQKVYTAWSANLHVVLVYLVYLSQKQSPGCLLMILMFRIGGSLFIITFPLLLTWREIMLISNFTDPKGFCLFDISQ